METNKGVKFRKKIKEQLIKMRGEIKQLGKEWMDLFKKRKKARGKNRKNIESRMKKIRKKKFGLIYLVESIETKEVIRVIREKQK
jgi:ribosomal protein L7Ae-like RNA K-turn-binding protein